MVLMIINITILNENKIKYKLYTMIKTFEQFVSEMYDNPVNEAFQSNKLRELIKQHGLPKNEYDKKMLYDLKDNEIIDVVSSNDEYWKKYKPSKGRNLFDNNHQATFKIELEDGYCIVIGNLNILKSYWDNFKGMDEDEKERKSVFKKRHRERHKGNLGNTGDDIHRKHLEKVSELDKKRFIEKLQSNIPEIIKNVKYTMDNIIDYLPDDITEDNDKSGQSEIETEITLDGNKYMLYINYSYYPNGFYKSYGMEYYNIDCELESFCIIDDDGNTEVNNEELNITFKTYKQLFDTYTIEDIEGQIYDYYDLYGVSPSDFL